MPGRKIFPWQIGRKHTFTTLVQFPIRKNDHVHQVQHVEYYLNVHKICLTAAKLPMSFRIGLLNSIKHIFWGLLLLKTTFSYVLWNICKTMHSYAHTYAALKLLLCRCGQCWDLIETLKNSTYELFYKKRQHCIKLPCIFHVCRPNTTRLNCPKFYR